MRGCPPSTPAGNTEKENPFAPRVRYRRAESERGWSGFVRIVVLQRKDGAKNIFPRCAPMSGG